MQKKFRKEFGDRFKGYTQDSAKATVAIWINGKTIIYECRVTRPFNGDDVVKAIRRAVNADLEASMNAEVA